MRRFQSARLRANRNDAQHAASARTGFSTPSSQVCPEFVALVIEDQEGFPSKSAEGGGLKNRRLAECKMSIGQVLISRTLSVCGEVAERLKAAVC